MNLRAFSLYQRHDFQSCPTKPSKKGLQPFAETRVFLWVEARKLHG